MKQQRITDLLRSDRPLLSVEFYPPQTDEAVEQLSRTAAELVPLNLDFVSVTYGAGGSTREKSARVSAIMKDEHQLNVMPHFTCVGATKEELGESIDAFHEDGYRNIMTLRGDPPKDQSQFVATEGGFTYASDLVAFIRERHPDICMGVAGYPEKHPEAADLESDLEHLKIKCAAGASFITTQLFFENELYFRFVDKVREKGIGLPVIPGIMPVLATKQIKRITKLCGSKLPKNLEAALDAAGDDAAEVRAVGSAWAKDQLAELLDRGVPGVHLYALNKAEVAIELMKLFRSKYA